MDHGYVCTHPSGGLALSMPQLLKKRPPRFCWLVSCVCARTPCQKKTKKPNAISNLNKERKGKNQQRPLISLLHNPPQKMYNKTKGGKDNGNLPICWPQHLLHVIFLYYKLINITYVTIPTIS